MAITDSNVLDSPDPAAAGAAMPPSAVPSSAPAVKPAEPAGPASEARPAPATDGAAAPPVAVADKPKPALPSAEAAAAPAPAPAPPVAAKGAEAPSDPAVAALCRPVAGPDPCGEDLDLAGDVDYLNFVAQAEGAIPTSFFSAEDGKPFDRSAVDFDSLFALTRPLLARTADIRLLILQARLSILNKNLAAFTANVAAVAHWLESSWDAVHPRAQDGNFSARSAALSMLDVPTVIFPLQYAPLFEGRRVGQVTYRGLMVARGEVNARSGEAKHAASAFSEALGDARPDALAQARKTLATLKAAIERIRNACAKQGMSPGLDNLAALVGKIIAYVDPTGTTAGAAAVTTTDGASQAAKEAPAAVGDGPTSLAEASAALAVIADYYSKCEPSSPVLPLARQAHQLIGKSFVEIMNVLVPSHVEKAAFQIGDTQIFELPVAKLLKLSEVAPVMAPPAAQRPPQSPPQQAQPAPPAQPPATPASAQPPATSTPPAAQAGAPPPATATPPDTAAATPSPPQPQPPPPPKPPAPAAAPAPGRPSGNAPSRFRVESRAQAVVLLELVQHYFRRTEPSSPIPMLLERARGMAERDFMGLLKEVLPKAALKNAGTDR